MHIRPAAQRRLESQPQSHPTLTARPLLALLALSLALALSGIASGAAHAQGPQGTSGREPGGRLTDPMVRAADVAAPAIVRITTLYSSHITLNFCGTTVTLPKSATGYSEGVLGTGAFVSAHGDILTADHLIHVDHDTLEQQLLADPAAQTDIANALNASPCFNFGPAIGAGDIGSGFLQSTGIEYHTTFDSPKTYVWRDTAYSGALASPSGDNSDLLKALMSAPYDQATILASSDFSHDDLAVLHVSEQNTPSIRLDDSANVQALDTLTVIGFPGNGDANNVPTNLLTPSFNLASVSAIKANTDGAELIQVGGNIEHGDSGGPALDTSGRIVGVVSFGGPDTQGMTSFLRSSDTARSLIATAKVDMRPGAFELAWERAFGDYAANYVGHWRRSALELSSLLKTYPQFKGATAYELWAQAQARREPLPQQRPRLAPVTIIALALLAALALALIATTLFRAARARPIIWSDLARLTHTGRMAPHTLLPDGSGATLLDGFDGLDDHLSHASRRLN